MNNDKKIKRKRHGFFYKGLDYSTYTKLDLKESAFYSFTPLQKKIFVAVLSCLGLALALNWYLIILALIGFLTIIYFIDLLFNFFLIFRTFSKTPEIEVGRKELGRRLSWPGYTILCPLYREWEILPQFITAISSLDYPKKKLQILLLLEEDDRETVEKVNNIKLPPSFKVIIVPHASPKTKSKACNFGLTQAKGKYAVIYDAEDIPEPNQLKKVVLAFEKVNKNVTCIQAKLNFYNPNQNLLTKIFTAEYSLWFDLVLPGLQSLGAPIPLGGTSNHFRIEFLKKLKGWDPFNVTEDCDLGIRLAKQGFQTAVVNSRTLEEANSSFKNWFPQRTRWIKGYIQTYFVHMRTPSDFIKNRNILNLVFFQLIVGGKTLSVFINPLMWFLTLSYFLGRKLVGPAIESFYPAPVFYLAVLSLIIGNFLYLYYYMIACVKLGHFNLVKYVFLVPFYWLSMSICAWQAVRKVISQPHYWAKTQHGLHLNNQEAFSHAQKLVGRKLISNKFLGKVQHAF